MHRYLLIFVTTLPLISSVSTWAKCEPEASSPENSRPSVEVSRSCPRLSLSHRWRECEAEFCDDHRLSHEAPSLRCVLPTLRSSDLAGRLICCARRDVAHLHLCARAARERSGVLVV